MIHTGVANRNLLRFLRAGAFGMIDDEIEPMSAFKWNKMFETAQLHNVLSEINKGLEMHSSDRLNNFSRDMLSEDYEETEVPDIDGDIDRILKMGVKDIEGQYTRLSNGRMNKSLDKVIYNEIHSDETNLPALHVLCLLIYNVNTTLTNGMKLNALAALGRYLREKGDRVDFVKLEEWLKILMMNHFADLIGSALVCLFDFEPGEIPFMSHEDKNIEKLIIWTLDNTNTKVEDDSYFVQLSSGFVSNDGSVMRKNLKRGLRYMRYYPLETVSNFISKFMKNLPKIEE